MHTERLETQIAILEQRLNVTPKMVFIEGQKRHNTQYYSLENLIKRKKKELHKRNHLDWLGQ